MPRLSGTDAATLPALGEVLAGKYRVESELGRGGMGVVYRATHVLTTRPVAIKWLLPDAPGAATARQRLIREARTASTISDPSIVDVFDIVDEGRTAFLVMELLEGELLSEKLARERLTIAAILQLLLPAMRAVARAHESGVIHRDLKPDNLFVCRLPDGSERLKVLDFGISKLVAPDENEVSITRSGMTVGSPHYMPLEQLQGVTDLDGRVDVYAFGVILYEALTGQKPFGGTSYGEIAVRVAKHAPERPRALRPEIPPMLERAVLGALARERQARYPDMRSLIHALEIALHPELDVLSTTAPMGVPHFEPARELMRPEVPTARPVEAPSTKGADTAVSMRPASHVRSSVVIASLLTGLVLSAWWWRSATQVGNSKIPGSVSGTSPSKPHESKVRPPIDPHPVPPIDARDDRQTPPLQVPPLQAAALQAPPVESALVSPRPAPTARSVAEAKKANQTPEVVAPRTSPAEPSVRGPEAIESSAAKPTPQRRAGAISPSDF